MGAKSKQTTPRLSVSTALSKANATDARLNAIVPNLASDLSPSLIYLPGAVNEINDPAGTNPPVVGEPYGWTAPDINNGQPYTVQVECFGAGGGGGGGAATGIGGGGGGAGGEYACEPNYPIVPGETYSYFCGKGGLAGASSMLLSGVAAIPGANGSLTVFDPRGKGITGGVQANGGTGGDQSGLGVGGRGGTGSVNSVHFDGGDGGTSSAGIMSDNPILGTTSPLGATALWWRLDDATGTLARDYTQFGRNSNGVTKGNSNAIVAPQTVQANPPQVPYGASTTYNGQQVSGEVMTACWQFDHNGTSGLIGGINVPGFALLGTAMSWSVWIKGSATAQSATDWYDGTHTNGVILTNKDVNLLTCGGFALSIGSSVTLSVGDGTHTNQSVTATSPSAIDGNWHMITATFSIANNRVLLYIDGTQVATSAPTITTIAGGSQGISIGYAKATTSYGFKGYMSNVWVQTVETSAAYISEAFGASVATGGSGGGASGGSAGSGNGGASAVATAGGAAGTSAAASSSITTGSGAGGAGGNANVAGSNAPNSSPYAGGGGGAGSRTAGVPTEFQLEIPCDMSAAYAGLDAQGAADGALYTVSADPNADESDPWYNTAATQSPICYSGGASDAPFKGSMNSLLTFPSWNSIDANATQSTDYLNSSSWTINKVYLKLTIETTNAANIAIGTWGSNAIIPMVDSDATLSAWGAASSALVIAFIPAGAAGRQVFIDMSGTTLAATMKSSALGNGFSQDGRALQGCGLLIGGLQGSSTHQAAGWGAWDNDEAPDWFCAFHGADATTPELSAALEVTYIQSTSAVLSAGNGGNGYILLKFISPQGTPVATLLPQAAVDAGGNHLAAGLTTNQITPWQPGVSPLALETWHNLGNAFALNITQLRGRYRYVAGPVDMGGYLEIEYEGITTGATASAPYTFANTLPAAYQPAGADCPLAVATTGGTTTGNDLCVSVQGKSSSSPGTVTLRMGAGLSGTTTYIYCHGFIPLS